MRFRPAAAAAETTSVVSRKKTLQDEGGGKEKVVAGSGRGAKKSSMGFDNNQQLLLEIWEVPWYTKYLVSFFMAYAGKNVESLLLSSRKSADIRLPPSLPRLGGTAEFSVSLPSFFLPVKKKLFLLFRQCLFCLAERILLFPKKTQKTTKKSPKFMRVLTHQQPTLCWNPQGYFPGGGLALKNPPTDFFFPSEKEKKKSGLSTQTQKRKRGKGEFKGTQRWCWREAPAGPDAGKKEEKKSGERK